MTTTTNDDRFNAAIASYTGWMIEIYSGETKADLFRLSEQAADLLAGFPDRADDIHAALRDMCLVTGLLAKCGTSHIDKVLSEALTPRPEINPDDVDSTYDDRDHNDEINPDDVDANHR